MKKTYLARCLKNGLLARWPDAANALNVYIEPFQWYHLDLPIQWNKYQRVVMEGLALWTQVLEGRISLHLTPNPEEAHINVRWRGFNLGDTAVEGGNCYRYVDEQSAITSAMILVNLTEGDVEIKNAEEILKRSLIPLIGQALGLCAEEPGRNPVADQFHQASSSPSDLYISWRDVETLRWMYRLPVGFNYQEYLKKLTQGSTSGQPLSQNARQLLQMNIDELVENLVENPKTRKLSFVPPKNLNGAPALPPQNSFQNVSQSAQSSPFTPVAFSSKGTGQSFPASLPASISASGATQIGGGLFPAEMRNRFLLQNSGGR